MLLIDADNVERYLRQTERLTPDERIVVRELPGGVSNLVLLVSRPSGEACFVLKQAREQLRVPDPWYCSIERIWREVAVLEVCHQVLRSCAAEKVPDEPTAAVPQLLFLDRENYLYAMTAAPAHEVWKSQLLRGITDIGTAAACGRLLGTLHAATWQRAEIATLLGDTRYFDALRLDPYYRHVAQRYSDLAPHLDSLIASLAEHPRCLVHGDFSPKNILLHEAQTGPRSLTLVDFEVGHFGDPAFDLGFFLSHLALKAVRAGVEWWSTLRLTFAFWDRYRQKLLPASGDLEFEALVTRGIRHFAGCLLARVEGKSRVEYLDSRQQNVAGGLARNLLFYPAGSWAEVVARFVNAMREQPP